jgi:catechol 2,3-dioxygenase-like lactoylglutathione lyase family enzyme
MAAPKRKSSRSRAAKPRPARKTPRRAPATARSRAARAPKSGLPKLKFRTQPEALRLRSFSAGFTANDLDRSIDFYTNVLGFIVGDRWTGDDGTLRGVSLKAGTCELNVSQDDWSKGRDRVKGVGVRLWCQTIQDVDRLAARVEASGHALAEKPGDRPWGVRAFSVDDPDGYHLTIYRDL